jgi:hypothetical protein
MPGARCPIPDSRFLTPDSEPRSRNASEPSQRALSLKEQPQNLFVPPRGRSRVRAAYLDDARQDQVSHSVRDVLHRRGALVSDHTSSRVLFRGYKPSGEWTWDRGGYVGIFQHTGEREVEVRLLLRARWPFRFLWLAALLNVIAVVIAFATRLSGTGMFTLAALGAFVLLVTGVLYLNTWRPVRREERELMEAFEAEFAKGLGDDEVLTEEEREERLFAARLEGELERRRVDEARKAEAPVERRLIPRPSLSLPRPRFKLARGPGGAVDTKSTPADSQEARPDAAAAPAPAKSRFALPRFGRTKADAPAADAAPPADETAEERRARLLARKAELEARRRDQGPGNG